MGDLIDWPFDDNGYADALLSRATDDLLVTVWHGHNALYIPNADGQFTRQVLDLTGCLDASI